MPFQTIDFKRFQAPQKRGGTWRTIAIVALILIALVAIALYFFGSRSADKTSTSATFKPDTVSQQSPKQTVSSNSAQQAASFDKRQYSNDDPASLWVVVNKRRPLQPKDYTPDVATPNVPLRLNGDNPEMMLNKQAIPSLEAMFAAAKKAGFNLMLASGYRPYQLQVSVYSSEVKAYGQAAADRESARPGFSEHQTGLAADIEPVSRQCEVQDCFGDTPEGKWVTENAHSYGFVLRYTPTGESTTGYRHETWHFRYVGKELAEEISKQGNPPLESFFGLPAAPDYQ